MKQKWMAKRKQKTLNDAMLKKTLSSTSCSGMRDFYENEHKKHQEYP